MSQLVPCPSCDRHVRLHDTTCPFCAGELNAQVLGALYASRRAPVPSGLKRAALMALSTVAAACGGKTNGTDDTTAPIIATENGGVTSEAATSTDDPLPGTPLYGGIWAPDSSEPATSSHGDTATAPSSDLDSTTESEFTGVAIPAYGIAPWYPTSDVPPWTSGSPTEADAGPTEADAGAETDAGAPDGNTGIDELTDLAQPEYGAPVPEQ